VVARRDRRSRFDGHEDGEMPLPERKSQRLEGYAYSSPGLYVVTIVANTRENWFGDVRGGVMHLNAAGEMVHRLWQLIPERFPSIQPDEIVVMPDHLHGILMLSYNLPEEKAPDLGSIVGAYKSSTTVEYGRGVKTHGWRAYPSQLWQRGFHDHIIRDDRYLERHRRYIAANPARWSEKHRS
jgi:putative transposase